MLLYLCTIVGAAACTSPADQQPDREATSAITAAVTSSAIAQASDDGLGDIAPRATCNGFEPGLPIPITKQGTFDSCMSTCLAGGISFSDCKRTCCNQIVHCLQCFEQ